MGTRFAAFHPPFSVLYNLNVHLCRAGDASNTRSKYVVTLSGSPYFKSRVCTSQTSLRDTTRTHRAANLSKWTTRHHGSTHTRRMHDLVALWQ